MRISIVVPAHNEEENIEGLICSIENSLDLDYELIIVNDHSVDSTAQVVARLCSKYPNLRIIDNLSGAGFANAIKAGFAEVRTEVVVPVMADSCDDLKSIKDMADKIKAGYDVVCGARYIRGGLRSGGSRVKGLFSSFVGRSLYYILGIPTHDIANAFKMYRKKVIDSMDIESKGFEVSMEIPLKAFFLGFKITEVATVWRERTKGSSSFSMFKLLPAYLRLYLWAIFKKIAG